MGNTDRAVSMQDRISQKVEHIKYYPKAVDTLLVVLNEVRDTSANCKYHTLDEEHIVVLHGVPGAFELLVLLRYKRHGDILKLDKRRRDLALIWMAISSLEIATSSTEYNTAKNSAGNDDNLNVETSNVSLIA